MNGKQARDTVRKKYGKDFYSKISKQRKVFSGGKTYINKEAARAAQKKAVESRLRNNELRKASERAEGETTEA